MLPRVPPSALRFLESGSYASFLFLLKEILSSSVVAVTAEDRDHLRACSDPTGPNRCVCRACEESGFSFAFVLDTSEVPPGAFREQLL